MPAIINPLDGTAKSRVLIQAGWQDVPHLDSQAKAELLAETPDWLREARSIGRPSLGAGAIYPIAEATIKAEPFAIPFHWPRAYALDVGWNWTTALWCAWDKDNGIKYLFGEYYAGEALPAVHAEAIKARGAWVPGVIDPAANNRGQRDGERIMEDYIAAGLEVTKADNAVNAGLVRCWQDLSIGRTKVFSTLQNFFSEYRLYRRDQHGKIVKKKDHLMDCFDAETEVLTRGGWLAFGRIGAESELATVNLETDLIEYQQPTELVERAYVGEMVRIGGRKMDALVTPNHRMIVYPRNKSAPEVRLAKDLKVWDRIKLHAQWLGERRGAVPVQAAYGREAGVDPLVWAELLGWYVAEGCLAGKVQTPGRGYLVSITQNPGPKADRIKELIDQTPWKWWYNESRKSFETSNKWLYDHLRSLGMSSYSKVAPQWVKDSEPRVIAAFIQGAVAGDGWTQGRSRTYATTSRRLADDMQELFIKTGKSASVRLGRAGVERCAVPHGRYSETVDQWWVGEWHSPHGLLRDSANKPNFSKAVHHGTVYCATVPNGTLIVRRNGKPMVAGNCMRYIHNSGEQVAKVKPPIGGTVNMAPAGPTNPGGY